MIFSLNGIIYNYMIKRIVFVILLSLLVFNLSYRIDLGRSPRERIGELMYFPSGMALRTLSMGFYTPLSDLVWLRFIQYYGEHRMTDLKFEYLYHILDILTTLDPRFLHAYTLGALMLTHDANRTDQAFKLLKKAMEKNPDEWRYHFVYGLINYLFLGNYNVAVTYFRLSTQKPTATDMPRRWIAYITYRRLGDLKTALMLWLDLYNHTRNPEEKAIAILYIKEIKMKMDIELLNSKIDEFTKKFGRLPVDLKELIFYNSLDTIPREPHGERYYIKAGKAHSTWRK